MSKSRLDLVMVVQGLVSTRSQAESWIKLGKVRVNGRVITKPGYFVADDARVELKAAEQYVSRAGLKLASVAQALGLDFAGKVVLDVGSSTGGFTDYALQQGAKKVIAVDVGTDQMHPTLRGNPSVELYEQTDVRDIRMKNDEGRIKSEDVGLPHSSFITLSSMPDIVLIDVSFISVRDILPHIATLSGPQTKIIAMLKPQFEAGSADKHKGVIKNDAMRREILRDFEAWAKQYFVISAKADSEVPGARGNRERFYVLTPTRS